MQRVGLVLHTSLLRHCLSKGNHEGQVEYSGSIEVDRHFRFVFLGRVVDARHADSVKRNCLLRRLWDAVSHRKFPVVAIDDADNQASGNESACDVDESSRGVCDFPTGLYGVVDCIAKDCTQVKNTDKAKRGSIEVCAEANMIMLCFVDFLREEPVQQRASCSWQVAAVLLLD